MKNKFVYVIMLFCIISNLVAHKVQAQDKVQRVIEIGKLDSINSAILKEKRLIEVFVPKNYKPGSTEKYDVLYVLDGGNWNTGLISKIQGFLEGESYMPPTIIVSIMGIDRNKDLTPTAIKSYKTSGGAAAFLGFIKDELIPYINLKYPSNGDNTLWGHSLGGLFVINALLNEPKTFKSYIAVDPSLWWDDCYIQKIAPAKLSALANSNITLYMSGREGQDGKGMKIDSMDLVLKKSAPAGFIWKSIRYPDETHSSVRLKSIYDGLKFTYGWHDRRVEFHPMSGIMLKEKPIDVAYFGDTTKVRYTTDGTEPTLSSPAIQSNIHLTAAAKLTVKQFTNRTRYDQVKTGTFTVEKALKPISKQKDMKPGGFHYAYYEGDFNSAEDLKGLKPQKSGITAINFDADKLPRKKNYALVIDGILESKEEGYYFFIFNADKDSKLYLNNRLLIKWEGSYNSRTYSYVLPLSKGVYSLRIEYLRKNPDFSLNLGYLTPSIMSTKDPIAIPLNLQYSHN